jgi:hypothetical protein
VEERMRTFFRIVFTVIFGGTIIASIFSGLAENWENAYAFLVVGFLLLLGEYFDVRRE